MTDTFSFAHDSSYEVSMNEWDIYPDDITDAGVLVKDLYPIGDCVLTPGDPSPVGRTEDGDLAYLIRKKADHLLMDRADAADLACLLHSLPDQTPDQTRIKDTLLSHAAPRLFHDETSHGELEHRALKHAVLTTGRAALGE